MPPLNPNALASSGKKGMKRKSAPLALSSKKQPLLDALITSSSSSQSSASDASDRNDIGQLLSVIKNKFEKKAEGQRGKFEKDLQDAIKECRSYSEKALSAYNVSLEKKVRLIESELNAIRGKRAEELKKLSTDYKHFEKAYAEAIKKIERVDAEYVKMGNSLIGSLDEYKAAMELDMTAFNKLAGKATGRRMSR